jgi:CPA1 family monovalent cation:H+ antiporter
VLRNVDLLFGLLLAVVVLTSLARQLRIAYPVLLVLGGLVLSFIPGVPSIALPPNLVLVLFLPPLLYWESLNVSYRDLRFSIRPILSMAIGLVLATIVAVAVVAHTLIPGFTWAAAFVLGATVGPTDEVAVAAIAERLPIPARLVTIIENESLLNDSFSLVAYNVAVAAVVTGTFSIFAAGIQVVLAGLGGIAIGLIVGWGFGQFRRWLDSPPIENTLSLLTGFAAYLPADALHLSGVLAVVACGLFLGRRRPRALSATTRLQNVEMWKMADFLLNGVLFILVGLQLHGILSKLSNDPLKTRVLHPLAIILTVVLLRIVWLFSATYLPRLLFPARAKSRPQTPWQETAIVAWAGMRGAVSLAAALAVPLVIQSAPFPHREVIIYITYTVILATLVGQGLTLPLLIRRLGVVTDEREEVEELTARSATAQAGLERLNSLANDGAPPGLLDDLREHLMARRHHYARQVGQPQIEPRWHWDDRNRVRREVVDAEREAVIGLRDEGVIGDDVMHKIERELDLEEVRLETQRGSPR